MRKKSSVRYTNWSVLQDGITAEIMALAQGQSEIAELLTKLKPVSVFIQAPIEKNTLKNL